MVDAVNSLVKYETAILVSSAYDSRKGPEKSGKNKWELAKDKNGQPVREDDYLNKILPP